MPDTGLNADHRPIMKLLITVPALCACATAGNQRTVRELGIESLNFCGGTCRRALSGRKYQRGENG
jgi:hypothetical protein